MSPFILGWAMGAMRQLIRTSELIKPFVAPPLAYLRDGERPDPPICKADTAEKVTTVVEGWFKDRNLALENVKNIINTHDVIAARDYVAAHKDEIYNYPFIKVMIDADKKGIKIPVDIKEAWALKTANIKNHKYIGVEGLMRGGIKAIPKEQFEAIDLIKPVGWNETF